VSQSFDFRRARGLICHCRYHWAFLVLPSKITDTSRAFRLHARNYFSGPDSVTWFFEQLHVDAKGTSKLLTTTPIGKVVDMDRLLEILRDIPIPQNEPDWNCVNWMREALDEISHDQTALEIEGLGADWQALRDSVMKAAALRSSQVPEAVTR
jgi:hypothetical protein